MAGRKKQTPVANATGLDTGSRRPRKTSVKTNLKKEDTPTQLNAPTKRLSGCENAETPMPKRQKTTTTKRSLQSNSGVMLGVMKEEPNEDFAPPSSLKAEGLSVSKATKANATPTKLKEEQKEGQESARTPTRRDTATIRREQDERCQGRVWLYKTEVVDYYRYNLACSDLLALPAYVKVNKYHPNAPPCRCFRVFHLNWLQAQINAGNGINLPAGSVVDVDKPQFVLENGKSICRTEIKKRYGPGLLPKQLKRIKPCKKARPVGGVRAVEHWNVCDIEALLQQGQNLKSICPPAPLIQRRSTVDYDYDDLLEVAEERDCSCCIWMGLLL